MFDEIVKDMEERIGAQTDSRMASPDEVRMCWLINEIEKLRKQNESLSMETQRLDITLIEVDDLVKEHRSERDNLQVENEELLSMINRSYWNGERYKRCPHCDNKMDVVFHYRPEEEDMYITCTCTECMITFSGFITKTVMKGGN